MCRLCPVTGDWAITVTGGVAADKGTGWTREGHQRKGKKKQKERAGSTWVDVRV